VAAWPSPNAPPAYGLSRSTSRGGTTQAGTVVKKLARRPTRIQTRFEEEEEGYASGDHDDILFELSRIRVKLHYQGDVRGMAFTPEVPFEDFVERVVTKFGKHRASLGLKFKDEDGGLVTLKDASDYDLAIETARESAKGKPDGKLEIWCEDL
jgi:hypothetical protein